MITIIFISRFILHFLSKKIYDPFELWPCFFYVVSNCQSNRLVAIWFVRSLNLKSLEKDVRVNTFNKWCYILGVLYSCHHSMCSSVRIVRGEAKYAQPNSKQVPSPGAVHPSVHPSIQPTAQLLHYWETPRYRATHRRSNYSWSYWCSSSNDHTEKD